jgi:hypothetical protein
MVAVVVQMSKQCVFFFKVVSPSLTWDAHNVPGAGREQAAP